MLHQSQAQPPCCHSTPSAVPLPYGFVVELDRSACTTKFFQSFIVKIEQYTLPIPV